MAPGLVVKLRTQLEPPAPGVAAASWLRDPGFNGELSELWECCAGGEILVDQTYGQSGLALFAAEEAHRRTRAARSREGRFQASADEIVVGELVGGDGDLIVRASTGAVFIAAPLAYREEWDFAGASLALFLDRYVAVDGEYFWVTEGRA